MIKTFKSSSDRLVSKIARILPRFNPNFITIVGVLPPVLFFWLLTEGLYGWALLALAGTALDSFDGAYARATGQTTKFGAILDASLDRFSDALIISAFGFAGLISWGLAIALIISSFMISYVKARAEATGQSDHNKQLLSAGPIERAQRLGLVFIGLAVHWAAPSLVFLGIPLLNIIFAFLLAASLITVWRRLTAASHIT